MFLTADKVGMTNDNWARIQSSMLRLVKSDTITQASEVTEESISNYFNAVQDQIVCDYEKSIYDNSFSFTSPTA